MLHKNLYVFCSPAVEGTGGGAAPSFPILPLPVEGKEVTYHFKKEKIRDADNKVIGEGKKHPSVKKVVPVPTAEGILKIVEAGGKDLEFLQELMRDAIQDFGRIQINALRDKGTDVEIKPEMIDDSQLAWSVIANAPRGEKRGLGISDEDWNDFAADYRAIMPGALNKDKDRIEKHVQLYLKKFSACRNDKKALQVLKNSLDVWAANTSQMEENQTVYEYLNERLDTLLKEDEKVLADNL